MTRIKLGTKGDLFTRNRGCFGFDSSALRFRLGR